MTAASFPGFMAELELVLRATLLIGAAWAASAALRKADASASARHMVWLLGIAALLALPLLWWLAPALELPIYRPEAAIPASASLPPPAAAAGSTAPDSPEYWGWSDALLVAYAIGAVLLLLRIAIFRLMLSRLWRDAEPARDAAWGDLMFRVAREMRLSRRVELRIARGRAMPMTWGTLAPKMLLPAEAEAWSPERRRLVLLHELAHVVRRDSLSRSAASLACALYWFHPGAWFAARQMRIEQEHAADDRVLTAGAPARTYALSLVHLAKGIEERSSFDHAAAMAGMCQLERRLVSITTPTRRNPPGVAFLSMSAVMASFVTLVVSAGVPVSAAPAVPNPLRAAPAVFASGAAKAASPERGEDRLDAQAPWAGHADTISPSEIGSRDGRAGPGIARVIVTEAGVPGRTLARTERADIAQAQTQPIVAHQSEPISGRPRPSPVDGPRLAAYGPNLPPADADRGDSDARIPELARRRGRGDPDASRNPGSRWNLPIQIVPPDGSGALSGRPGLSLQLVPN